MTFTEAPVSVNFFATSPQGYNVQITLRGEQFDAVMDGYARVVGRLDKEGWYPKGGNVSAPVTPDIVPMNHPAPEQQASTGGHFLTDSSNILVAEVKAGNVYWKLENVPGTKYPVNVWPEVLEAANLTGLDPMKTYDLSGYTAYFDNKTSDSGKTYPNKITRLEKL